MTADRPDQERPNSGEPAAWRLDRLCDDFEAALREGRSPNLQAYLSEAPASRRSDLLRELLALEIEYRRDRGDTLAESDYMSRFPGFTECVRHVFAVLDSEASLARTAPSSGPPESASLLRQIQRGDPAAWGRLARLYGPLLYRWVREAGLQDADAADIGQEVYRTVAQRIHSFEHGGPGHTFCGWLWTITRNKLGDYFRRINNQPLATGGTDAQHRLDQAAAIPPEAPPESDDFDVEQSLAQRALRLIQQDFEERTWQAFWRSTVDGQATDVIAEDLGMTVKAVRQAKYRVLQRLRSDLDQYPS